MPTESMPIGTTLLAFPDLRGKVIGFPDHAHIL